MKRNSERPSWLPPAKPPTFEREKGKGHEGWILLLIAVIILSPAPPWTIIFTLAILGGIFGAIFSVIEAARKP